MANNEMPENKEIAKKELSMSERFMNKVVAEFNTGVGEIALTDFQKRLAQNYFIAIDATLKTTEEKRLKRKKNQDPVPATWANINLEKLARDVVSYARIGLDPAQKNHINMIPFKDNKVGKYNIGFIEGYRGIELKAKKYGQDIPDHVIVELVYSSDKFKSYKKDRNNVNETYEFEIVNDFDRGNIIGGFYYHLYALYPEKNKLVVFKLEDILKRKPEYASVEFWGGEKDSWKDGKIVGKEKVDGWFAEMCWKTVYRAAYNAITIDSQKIDDDYMRLKSMEETFSESKIALEIEENANGPIIDVEAKVIDESETGDEQQTKMIDSDQPPKQNEEKKETKQMSPVDSAPDGPGF